MPREAGGIGTDVPGLFKARTGNLLRNWAEQQSKVRDLGMDWWSDRDWNPGPLGGLPSTITNELNSHSGQ